MRVHSLWASYHVAHHCATADAETVAIRRLSAWIVSLPEWGSSAKIHGATCAEAVANGREVLELAIATQRAEG
jgi:predicted RNase H-like HicB family nuclease